MEDKDDVILVQDEYIKLLERECENQARLLFTRLNIRTPHDTVVLGKKFRDMIASAKAKIDEKGTENRTSD